jgi:hypothetical protein
MSISSVELGPMSQTSFACRRLAGSGPSLPPTSCIGGWTHWADMRLTDVLASNMHPRQQIATQVPGRLAVLLDKASTSSRTSFKDF